MFSRLHHLYRQLNNATYPKRLSHSRRRLTTSLRGFGLEIGPGNLPMKFKHQVKIQYLDTNTQELLAHYYPKLTFNQLQNFIIGDADNLKDIPNNYYDFLVASHVIEHVKNPFKALKRWVEVVKPGGYLYIIFPNRDECFDKGRPYTTVGHLLSEYRLSNHSQAMYNHLTIHIYEHYANNDYKNKIDQLMEIDINAQIRAGAAHYHVWGPQNTRAFFQSAQNKLKLNIKIIKSEHRVNELRYLISKN